MKIPWRRAWQPTLVFLPGELRVWQSLQSEVRFYSSSQNPHTRETFRMFCMWASLQLQISINTRESTLRKNPIHINSVGRPIRQRALLNPTSERPHPTKPSSGVTEVKLAEAQFLLSPREYTEMSPCRGIWRQLQTEFRILFN